MADPEATPRPGVSTPPGSWEGAAYVHRSGLPVRRPAVCALTAMGKVASLVGPGLGVVWTWSPPASTTLGVIWISGWSG